MSALAKIHVAKKQLGLTEADYRDMLQRVAGSRSTLDMSEGQRGLVLDEMRRLGFSDRPVRRPLAGPYAAKLQALWIAAWNLGIVRQRDDRALVAFCERQTGISHVRFVRHSEDARKVIEALKAWLAREGGVDWSPILKGDHPHKDHPGYRIAVAQWRRLVELGVVKPFAAHLDRFDLSSLETGYGYAVTRKGGFNHYLPADWIKLMNALGAKLRGAMERRHPREMANG
jgi:hypothetical protein